VPSRVLACDFGLKAALAILSVALLSAQAPSNQAEMTQHDATPTFSTGVNLVLVPVVVRDGTGKAIGNLNREDFQLYDKGKLQYISRFYIETPAAPLKLHNDTLETDADGVAKTNEQNQPKEPVASRFIAWLFDDVHLEAADLLRARQAADQQLIASLEPGSRAALFTTSGRIMVEFTGDRDKLHEGLNRILPAGTAIEGLNNCPDVSYYQADLIVNHDDMQALQAAEQEYTACNPPPPGIPASQSTALAESASRAEAQRQLDYGDRDTRLAMDVLTSVIRRMATLPGSRSVVMVSPGFFLTQDHRVPESELMDRAIRANVTINSLDARGVYVIMPGGDASTSVGLNLNAGLKSQYQISSAQANADVLAELASATGGTFIQNTNDLAGALKRIAAPPEYIYVLGFSPANLKFDGSFHALKVSVVKPKAAGLSVLARRGYYVQKHATDPIEQAKQQIEEAFFSREELKDLPMELHTQYFKTSQYKARVSILARIDIRQLHYRKADGRNNDVLTVVGGVFDRDGNYVTGIEKIVDMKLKDETLAALNGPSAGITVKNTMDVASGSYVVRLVVRDSEGQLLAAQNGALEIP
jgi:VWFA-related protein